MDRSIVLSAIALAGVFAVFVRQSAFEAEMRQKRTTAASANAPVSAANAAPVEVAHHMARIQAHAEKLWWAGQGGNLELAKFYRHEIKEEMEVIAQARVVDDGVPVGEHMQVYGIRAIDALKEQLATQGLTGFNDHYETLINTCNSCHAVTGHPYLRMRIPATDRFSGQVFSY